MPKYCFWCDKCSEPYEETIPMSEIEDYNGKCPECKSKKVHRHYASENVCVSEGIKTIGSYAERNADRMSDDHKHHIDSKTRRK